MAVVTWGNRIKAEILVRNSMWRVQPVMTERFKLYFSFVFYFLFIRRVYSELTTMLSHCQFSPTLLPIQDSPFFKAEMHWSNLARVCFAHRNCVAAGRI